MGISFLAPGKPGVWHRTATLISIASLWKRFHPVPVQDLGPEGVRSPFRKGQGSYGIKLGGLQASF